MSDQLSATQKFKGLERPEKNQIRETIATVHVALKEKGYNPITQIVGYILSGDPTYITSHNNARTLIGQIERDELLEEIVKDFLQE